MQQVATPISYLALSY